MLRKIVFLLVAFAALAWALNSSLFASRPKDAGPKLLAHRGVHQLFAGTELKADTCTANPVRPITHDNMENTIPSMRAAFEAGADVVELDVHLTPDKKFAVFHDWTLDCRTNGTGVTEETPMPQLKVLDVGHGYTADGETFPLRGKGVGLMPTLAEVFEALPDKRFLINFKSRRAEEGEKLAAMLNSNPAWRRQVLGVYGGEEPTRKAMSLVAGLPGYDKASLMACLGQYEAYGWTGVVPAACRNKLIAVPANYAWALWGWPDRFLQRMRNAGSDVILVGPYGGGFTSGIDETDQLSLVPAGFDGYVWTNRIEAVGPALKAKAQASRN